MPTQKGYKQSPEHIANKIASQLGKPRTEYAKAAISKGMTGRKWTPGQKAKFMKNRWNITIESDLT